MADIAASVLTRLKNKAQASGRSYQLSLQLFCQEEFLRRLKKSKYAENFVLKGGLFIYSLTEFDSRVTVDVDFFLRQMPNTPEQLRVVLEEIIATPTETSVYKGYKRDKIEMRGDRAEISDFPLYLNTVAGGLDCRDQTIGGFSFVVKIYAVPVVEIIG